MSNLKLIVATSLVVLTMTVISVFVYISSRDILNSHSYEILENSLSAGINYLEVERNRNEKILQELADKFENLLREENYSLIQSDLDFDARILGYDLMYISRDNGDYVDSIGSTNPTIVSSIFDYSVEMYDGDRMIGVLGAHVSAQDLSRGFTSISETNISKPYLFDENSILILHYNPASVGKAYASDILNSIRQQVDEDRRPVVYTSSTGLSRVAVCKKYRVYVACSTSTVDESPDTSLLVLQLLNLLLSTGVVCFYMFWIIRRK